jgi:secreted Zn-dependent insulinase-like peptidase
MYSLALTFEHFIKRTLSKPHQALGALINYQGRGSLAAYLTRELALATSVGFAFARSSDCETFSVSVGLTPQGLARRFSSVFFFSLACRLSVEC